MIRRPSAAYLRATASLMPPDVVCADQHRKGDTILLMQVLDQCKIVRLHADIVEHCERNEITERRLLRSEGKRLPRTSTIFSTPRISRATRTLRAVATSVPWHGQGNDFPPVIAHGFAVCSRIEIGKMCGAAHQIGDGRLVVAGYTICTGLPS